MYNTASWICYYQLSEHRSPIPLSPLSEGDRMDPCLFLSLPIITGGKGGAGGLSAAGRRVNGGM